MGHHKISNFWKLHLTCEHFYPSLVVIPQKKFRMTNEIGRIHVRELSPYPGEIAVLLLCYLAVQVFKLWIKSHFVAKRTS